MITIRLITDRAREIADKLKNKKTLTEEDKTFASNALTEFAERLERKSASATRTENDLLPGDRAEQRRVSILESRIEKHFKELCGLKVEMKKAGRKPLEK